MVRRRRFRLPAIRLTLPKASRALLRALTVIAPPRAAAPPVRKTISLGRVSEVTDFGSNPGQLTMYVYTPKKPLRAQAPLIVVLHGCGQFAESFARHAGWIALADHFGVPLLLPEQATQNNAGRCFNWFNAADSRRGGGEAMSIRQMVRNALVRFRSDPKRVFVVGLSAGGAMAAALLAGYPAVFNAGAIVAGMPVGAAGTTGTALLRMHHANPLNTRAGLAQAVTRLQKIGRRSWPRVSVWHGLHDRTIDPANGAALAVQWSAVHGFAEAPDFDDTASTGIRRRGWGRPDKPAVEYWTLPEMGHGFPVDAATAGGGAPGYCVLDAGIAGAYHMAAFFGLAL